jgi:two-component system NtrC family response regulator
MMHSGKVLIIDDEEALRKLLGRIISLESFKVVESDSLHSAKAVLTREQIDVVLCDVKLPDGNGVDFVPEIKKISPLSEVIMLTAFGNIADGVRAIKNGAFDYITKGNDNDRVIPLLSQALVKVNERRKAAIQVSASKRYSFEDIIGESETIKQAVSLAERIAPATTAVLLLGETGTGKEVFANAIHYGSKRLGKPFVAINCSAFTKDLLEGELFGHKAGAYTGAIKDKDGLIELANEGTLFLDEIGEMNIDLQAKLLRVLENGEFIKLGDTKTSKVDVRVIAATNRDLEKDIETGHFREDLYYRLNVFTIHLPSLRERPEDILPIAEYFIEKFRKRENKQPVGISKDVIKVLQQHSWKGNIRELRNMMERASVLVDGDVILPEHLPYDLQQYNPSQSAQLTLSNVEKSHIRKVLLHTKGNKPEAARLLDIGLTTLYRKIEEYAIR